MITQFFQIEVVTFHYSLYSKSRSYSKNCKIASKGGIDKDTFNAAMSLRVVKIMQMAEYLCAGSIESNDYFTFKNHYICNYSPF